jgi:hypothetical protein
MSALAEASDQALAIEGAAAIQRVAEVCNWPVSATPTLCLHVRFQESSCRTSQ